MINKYIEELKLHSSRANEDEYNPKKWYYLAPAISIGVVVLVIIVLMRKRCLKKQKRNEESVVYTIPVSDQCSIDYIYRPVYRNQRNPIYLVPYSALPEDFDFSRPDVIVRGDYIILKDLHILEQPVIRPPSIPSTPTTPTPTYLEEFKNQAPYNPNFY